MIRVLSPAVEAQADATLSLAPRLDSLDGRRVAIVNNSWRCMDIVTEHLQDRLLNEFGAAEVFVEVLGATQRVTDARLDELAAEYAAVVVGIGNCGSCTAWSIHDSVELEARGVPTVTFCTEVFNELAHFVCVGKGLADLSIVPLPHPLNNQPEAFIRQAVDDNTAAILGALVVAKEPALV